MGHSQTTPIGRLAVNIEDDDDEILKAYLKNLDYAKSQTSKLDSMGKSIIIRLLNEAWMYGVDLRTVKTDSNLMYHVDRQSVDEIEKVKFGYLQRVLNLCLRTDICSKTGMSLADFMGLEYPVFEYIEKKYYEHKPAEQKALEDIAKDLTSTGSKAKK